MIGCINTIISVGIDICVCTVKIYESMLNYSQTILIVMDRAVSFNLTFVFLAYRSIFVCMYNFYYFRNCVCTPRQRHHTKHYIYIYACNFWTHLQLLPEYGQMLVSHLSRQIIVPH